MGLRLNSCESGTVTSWWYLHTMCRVLPGAECPLFPQLSVFVENAEHLSEGAQHSDCLLAAGLTWAHHSTDGSNLTPLNSGEVPIQTQTSRVRHITANSGVGNNTSQPLLDGSPHCSDVAIESICLWFIFGPQHSLADIFWRRKNGKLSFQSAYKVYGTKAGQWVQWLTTKLAFERPCFATEFLRDLGWISVAQCPIHKMGRRSLFCLPGLLRG